jgi:hypothetical protein
MSEAISPKEHIPIQLLETESEVLNDELASYSRSTAVSDTVIDGKFYYQDNSI